MRAIFKPAAPLAIAGTLLAWGGLALADPPAPAPAEQVVRVAAADGAQLVGRRLARPGAKPILLLHGILNNDATLDPLARRLYDQGFDVWVMNFRGHGNGELESIMRGARPGERGFAKLVTDDVPAMVDRVFAETGQKLLLYGHSMGGMAAKLYLEGVTWARGPPGAALEADDALALFRADKIAGLVTAGSPVHFRHIRAELRWFSTFGNEVLKRLRGRMPSISLEIPPDEAGRLELADRIRGAMHEVMRAAAGTVTPGFLMNPRNFTDDELLHLFARGLSAMSFDLGGDFAGFVAHGYRGPGGFNYETPRPIHVPYLALSARKDGLAPASDIRADMEERERLWPGSNQLVEVADSAHMELAMGERNLSVIVPQLTGFARDPAAYR
jgi:pimeloyl-ACP methyl ester carboxylesterase